MPDAPRDRRPLAGLLLGLASVANLVAVYTLLRYRPDTGLLRWDLLATLVILLAMLQGFSGAQSIEGRRLVIARLAVVAAGIEALLLVALPVRDPAVWVPGGLGALVGIAVILLLLPRRAAAVGKERSTTL